MKDINPGPVIVSGLVIGVVIVALYAARQNEREYHERHRTIDVEETCEQLHAFVHNGRKYYCAPWIEADDTHESAPTAQETTHA